MSNNPLRLHVFYWCDVCGQHKTNYYAPELWREHQEDLELAKCDALTCPECAALIIQKYTAVLDEEFPYDPPPGPFDTRPVTVTDADLWPDNVVHLEDEEAWHPGEEGQ